MSAREEVLGRIRAALRDAPEAVEVPREYHLAGDGPADGLADLLADRLDDYRATVRRCAPDAVAAEVAAALAAAGARRVVVPAGLPPEWTSAWDGTVLTDPGPDGPLDVTTLDGVDGVVTGCAVAVALTGTIVLDAGEDQGRRALTLVPDLHVVVVPADRVVHGVPDMVARTGPDRPLTLISGPSATSDIELNRVEGVHGPRRLVVVMPG